MQIELAFCMFTRQDCEYSMLIAINISCTTPKYGASKRISIENGSKGYLMQPNVINEPQVLSNSICSS